MRSTKKIITLVTTDPKGFYIDKAFVRRVTKRVKAAIRRREKMCEKRVCREIVSEFLESFEDKEGNK